MTAAEFRKRQGLPFYPANATKAHPVLQSHKPQRVTAQSLASPRQTQEAGIQRATVCITGYRVRLLDPDNFAGGCKDLLDGLRHAGLIHEDTEAAIDFQPRQVRVAHFHEERTEITLTSQIDLP